MERLEFRALLSAAAGLSNSAVQQVGDVFYIEMENHNLTQPAGLTGGPQQILGNQAAPYLNSLMTPGNPNAAQTAYASNYYNVDYNNPAVSIHPSEPNYVWQEAGLAGPLNDNDPFPSNIVNSPNLSGLLQNAGISWKSYQEDIDLTATSGSVNQPAGNALTSTVAPQSQWTVPLASFNNPTNASGAPIPDPAYSNAYNGSNYYGFAPKHDGQLFFTDTNGSSGSPNFSPSNPEAQFYAPLQQLQTDLNNATVARYNMITPDLYNDMHNAMPGGFTYNGHTYTGDQSAIAAGDNFLSIIIPEIMASQAYKNNGAIVIRFDESEGGNTTQFTLPEIVISPLAKGNAYNSTLPYTHSSDLKTMQDLFNVSGPGGVLLGDSNTAGTNDLSDLFKTEVNGTGSTVAATVGGTFSGTLAKFIDEDGDTNPSDFTATIDWGDGTSSSPDASAGTVSGGAGGFSVTGSHSYANEGIYTATVTINDTADGNTTTIKAEVLADPNAVYVTAVYQDVLGRAPDGGGLVFWTHDLDTGTAVSAVALDITHSAEYFQNFVIKPTYLSLLGRAADAAGLQYWTTQMLAGLTDQQLEAGFIASDEFYQNAGGTDLDWVDSVYLKLLGRPADQNGATYWTGQLATLEKTESDVLARSQVAVQISSSPENNTNLINDDYMHYLGRAADSGGLTYWLSQFAAGATNEDVIAGFTGSAEYYKEKTGVNP